MSALAKPRHETIGRPVKITFGQHYRQQGTVLEVFPRDAVRKQDMAMIKLNDGRIISNVPVKDLQVTA